MSAILYHQLRRSSIAYTLDNIKPEPIYVKPKKSFGTIAANVRPAAGTPVSPPLSPHLRLVKYGANLRQKFPPGSLVAPLCDDLPTCAGLSREQSDPSSAKPLSRFGGLFSDPARTSTKIAPKLQARTPQSIVTLFTVVSHRVAVTRDRDPQPGDRHGVCHRHAKC